MAVDEDRPNQASNKEKAEGSRENVNVNPESELPESSFGESGGGITNRPLEEEEQNQDRVPPRGERKDGAHGS
jgi:hypothetical protein